MAQLLETLKGGRPKTREDKTMRRYVGNWQNDNITKITIKNGAITELQAVNALKRMGVNPVLRVDNETSFFDPGMLRTASVQGGEVDPVIDFEIIK